MKSLISFFFIISACTRIFSQADIPVFDRMFGLWEGSYEAGGTKFHEQLSTSWVLEHNFFRIYITDKKIDNNRKGSEEVFYFGVSADGTVTGWSMDHGGYTNIINYTGSVEENKVILKGSRANLESRITLELKDDQLNQIREIKVNGKDSVNREIMYASIRYDYKITSLPSKYERMGETWLAYICHLTEHFVSVLDIKNDSLIGRIQSGDGSNYIRFSPDGNTGYISNFNSGTLTVFDKKTNETITTVDAGDNPTDLLLIKNSLLISHQSMNGLWVLDRKTNTVKQKKTWGTGFMFLIEKENKIYMPQIFTPFLLVIDPDRLEILKRIKTGGRPMGMAFTKDKRFGYMCNMDLNEIMKFDTRTDSIVKHIQNIKNPRDIVSSPDGKLIYVVDPVEEIVFVIDSETDLVSAEIKGFSMPVNAGFSPDGKRAYIVNQRSGNISVVDTGTNTIIGTVNVAGNPITIMIDSGN